jgi:hypothetical protein
LGLGVGLKLMRILITNTSLDKRGGTQLYVRDIALALHGLGHELVCYSSKLGEIADELVNAGIAVTSRLGRDLGPFDLIHGQHEVETTLAALTFPRTPVISFCHGASSPKERACTLPNVVQIVAVDMACRERLMEDGVDLSRIKVLLNFVDTNRFLPRLPLPDKPKRALVFSNYAKESTQLPAIREACAQYGLELDVIGQGVENQSSAPESILQNYDLVFAKARAAIEAMAVGCAVVICDYWGVGSMVTSANFDQLRAMNFGFKTLVHPLESEPLRAAIDLYNAQDAAEVSRRIRKEASLEGTIPQLLALYDEAVATEISPYDPLDAGLPFVYMKAAEASENQSNSARVKKLSLAMEEQSKAYESRIAGYQEDRRQLKEEAKDLRQQLVALKSATRTKRPWWQFHSK